MKSFECNVSFYFVPVFTKDFPARSCVQIAKIGLDAKVELEVVALTGNVKTLTN